MKLPEHLKLAGHWADSALAAAQAAQLAAIRLRLEGAAPRTVPEQLEECLQAQGTEHEQTLEEACGAKQQLDQLGHYLDKLEANVAEMEQAMGMAD
ncbi:hypothetical protein IWW36_001674 [Coemansia brasiliensis]|uniref:Uncharacterized protein n=1 Tax=Coemansia brasiliensis TaxID=2650707 RepID=A0A9W8I8N1_9FUNG|nr:hypothetical protein IWW36_001674 [Coemansia brasiliensis]